MATITAAERSALRELACVRNANVNYLKAHIDGALQAIEDRMTGATNVGARSVKAALGADIEAAAPGIFSAGQKDDLFLLWSDFNRRRGGII